MDKGSDNRRHNFFIVDNEAIDDYGLTPQEGWLYIVILRHINQQTGIAFPSIATLQRKTRMSRPTVIKYLKALQEKKLIEIESQQDDETGGNKSNHYKAIPLVKEVNQGSQTDLLPLVKEVNPNNTNIEQDSIEQEKEHSEPVGSGEAESAKPERKRSAQQMALDAMIEAIAKSFRLDRDKVTHTQWNEFRKSGKELLQAGATPQDMEPLHGWCAKQGWPSFTSVAMAKNYANFERERKRTAEASSTVKSQDTRAQLYEVAS